VKTLGVDPGLGGALAIYDPDKTHLSGMRWIVLEMPIVGDPPEVNAPAIRDWLRKYSPDQAYLERVNAMPSIPGKNGLRRAMGAQSAFRFGGTFYALKAILACCDIPVSLVTPQTWKRQYGLKGPEKELSRLRALELFPEASTYLGRKRDQNIAEAMLIAAHRLSGIPFMLVA
jgi:crossover junction endodeoxyribonuclease RuvC